MRFAFAVIAAGLLSVFCPGARAQDVDLNAYYNHLLRSQMEDYDRQRIRLRAMEDDLDANAPDFSKYGVPADTVSSQPAVRSPGVTCVTTGLGGGDSITTCH